MSYFAGPETVAHMRRLINWSSPLTASDVAELNGSDGSHNNSNRSSSGGASDPCAYWQSGTFGSGASLTSEQERVFFRNVALASTMPDDCRMPRLVDGPGAAPPLALAATATAAGTPTMEASRRDRRGSSSRRGGGDRRGQSCSTGLCWAASVAAMIQPPPEPRSGRAAHVERSTDAPPSSSSQTDAPLVTPPPRAPFLILIGDSRVRNMWQRFIMMVRSNQAGGDGEMRRGGVVDNYFHQNASYVVTNAGDAITVLPFGVGCDSERVRRDLVRTAPLAILVVCLSWHIRTVATSITRFDVATDRLLSAARPDAVIYMPTLHDCVGAPCHSNDAFAWHVANFSRGLGEQLERGNIRRRLVLMTTPSSVWTRDEPMRKRNRALKQVARQLHDKFEPPPPPPPANLSSRTNEVVAAPSSPPPPPPPSPPVAVAVAARLVDAFEWVRRRKPVRCDRVHNMCNFRPMMGHGNVTHFRAVCNWCVDVADFCFWLHVRRALR